VKNSAAMPSKAAVESSPKPVAHSIGGATRKRAADFFGEGSESEDDGRRQLGSSKPSGSKHLSADAAKETPAAKPGAEKSKTHAKTKKLKIDATNGEERQVGEVSTRQREMAQTPNPGLDKPGLPKVSRKSKRPKIDGTALEAIRKTVAEEPALNPGATQSRGANKANANGALKAGKSGHTQQKQVTETLSEAESDESDEEDDQTIALLKGFESSEDEGESLHEGFIEGQAIPGLPKEKKTRKRLKGIEETGNGTPGVIYVGYFSTSIPIS
jgi:nucleolar protein 15